jgi:hypothetical protein
MMAKKIVFRHTPKCAGTYIWACLKTAGTYMSLGSVKDFPQPCPAPVLNYFGIKKLFETGVVESDCMHHIPQVIRAHDCLNHINKNTHDDIFVLSNIRHPITMFFSEFYHHSYENNQNKLTWKKILGDDIDKYINGDSDIASHRPQNLNQWSDLYIKNLTLLKEQAHLIILQENTQAGLDRLEDCGFTFERHPTVLNVTPVRPNKYKYRLGDIKKLLEPAINFYEQFVDNY